MTGDITSGSKMTGNNSDFLLVDGDLSSDIKVVKLSKNIYKKIRENIFWAISYNLVTIPFAMLAILHPVIAELVMAGSSMSVVANARKLRKENIEPDYQKNKD
ncbi:P-type E1-E2 ATPase [Halanaerobium saccharolyticum]|uniref:P-type E1-E2 ATPase n=2 Tax=Halanaerobium saccharolyticum TaxID=43595 RepID=A0A4R7YUY4_9FIRM|nr:P-type E1-E2 ATPase [Halanaerobium saccharolyticum]TDX52558.1 P-type E1-E2 ATPase [Halanaerobium saccharolyticum]